MILYMCIFCKFCFMYNCQILTAGANAKIALWDMERPDPVSEFIGHHSEVMG